MSTHKAFNEREYHFTPRDFEKVRKLIREHAGILLNDGKQDMVYSRIARRIRAKKLETFNDRSEERRVGKEC